MQHRVSRYHVHQTLTVWQIRRSLPSCHNDFNLLLRSTQGLRFHQPSNSLLFKNKTLSLLHPWQLRIFPSSFLLAGIARTVRNTKLLLLPSSFVRITEVLFSNWSFTLKIQTAASFKLWRTNRNRRRKPDKTCQGTDFYKPEAGRAAYASNRRLRCSRSMSRDVLPPKERSQ